jgi:hypothetical protein
MKGIKCSIILAGLFYSSLSLAAAILTIVPSTSSVTLRADGQTSVTYRVTSNASLALRTLTIDAAYKSTGNTNGLTLQSDSCSGQTLPAYTSCTFGLLISGANQPTSFVLTPKVSANEGQVRAIPDISPPVAPGKLTVNVYPVPARHPVYAYFEMAPIGFQKSPGSCNGLLQPVNTSNLTFGTPVPNLCLLPIINKQRVAPRPKKPLPLKSHGCFAPGHSVDDSTSYSLPYGTSIAASPDGQYVYVAEQPNINASGNADIAVLTAGDTPTVALRIALPNSSHFYHFFVALTPNGKNLYVAGTDGNSEDAIYAIDLTTSIVTSISQNTGLLPIYIAISPDGSRAYVVNELGEATKTGMNPGSISVINTTSQTIVDTYYDGSPGISLNEPAQIGISPDGTTLYVGNNHIVAGGDCAHVSTMVLSTSTFRLPPLISTNLILRPRNWDSMFRP